MGQTMHETVKAALIVSYIRDIGLFQNINECGNSGGKNKMSEMEKRENSNVFRFSLHQGETLLCEKIFDADQFNPFTRYSIDVRDILPRAITRIQKMLSRRGYDVMAEVGRLDDSNPDAEDVVYDLFGYRQNMINQYPREWRNDMRYNPQSVVQRIEEKTIRGVPCKIGLYINENPIVEREFYVDGFNSVALVSLDIVNVVTNIA
jgi:hypothetical protein